MGVLTVFGQPLTWNTAENTAAIPRILAHGVQQFIQNFKQTSSFENYPFLWGEEVEAHLVHVSQGKVQLSLEAATVLDRLQKTRDNKSLWHPEYGSFMIESIPGSAYDLSLASLESVEHNIQHRYDALDAACPANTMGVVLTTFPRMGLGNFARSSQTSNDSEKANDYSQSLFVPDGCINQTHPRFRTLTRNIRLRRGRKVCIQIPLYVDEHTLRDTVDTRLNIDAHPMNGHMKKTTRGETASVNLDNRRVPRTRGSAAEEHAGCALDNRMGNFFSVEAATATASASLPDAPPDLRDARTRYYYPQYVHSSDQARRVREHYDSWPGPPSWVRQPCIYMDCMAFGMGCNCLQVTMQLPNMHTTRYAYDQLVVLAPIFLALTCATPIQKGLLCDSDVRWSTIVMATDDRTEEEACYIRKPRYDSVSTYLATEDAVSGVDVARFNDVVVHQNQMCYSALREHGVDELLARHVAYLFIRNPLVIFDEAMEPDPVKPMLHFDNVQTTNWNSVRLKPPPLDDGGTIGWRLEFRVMEIMPTALENAAFSVFVAVLTAAMVKYRPLLYTALSTVDDNFGRAHRINPCAAGVRYVMRKDIFDRTNISTSADETAALTVDEIVNGRENGYYGLIPLVRRYLREERLDSPRMERYLRLIGMRAAGTIPTTAHYLREFVLRHPSYRRDSRVAEDIAHDLVVHVHKIMTGELQDDSYLPKDKLNAGL